MSGATVLRGTQVPRVALAVFAAGAVLSGALALLTAPVPIPLDLALVAHVGGMLAGYLVAVMGS